MNIVGPMLEDIVANHKRLQKRRKPNERLSLSSNQSEFARRTVYNFEKERLYSFNRALLAECRRAASHFFDQIEVSSELRRATVVLLVLCFGFVWNTPLDSTSTG